MSGRKFGETLSQQIKLGVVAGAYHPSYCTAINKKNSVQDKKHDYILKKKKTGGERAGGVTQVVECQNLEFKHQKLPKKNYSIANTKHGVITTSIFFLITTSQSVSTSHPLKCIQYTLW
jgi:hypothetical protein